MDEDLRCRQLAELAPSTAPHAQDLAHPDLADPPRHRVQRRPLVALDAQFRQPTVDSRSSNRETRHLRTSHGRLSQRWIVSRVDPEPRDIAENDVPSASGDQVRRLKSAELDRHGLSCRPDQGGEFVLRQREPQLSTIRGIVAVLREFHELPRQARTHATREGRAQSAEGPLAADERLLEEALFDMSMLIEDQAEQRARDPRIHDGRHRDGHVLARRRRPEAALAEDVRRTMETEAERSRRIRDMQ